MAIINVQYHPEFDRHSRITARRVELDVGADALSLHTVGVNGPSDVALATFFLPHGTKDFDHASDEDLERADEQDVAIAASMDDLVHVAVDVRQAALQRIRHRAAYRSLTAATPGV